MDITNFIANLNSFVGAVVLATGTVGGMAFALFRWLGTKWLDEKFNARLQSLKAEQDKALKYIQFSIDREIHRAKKLYDNEFTALSESWRLLIDAYQDSVLTISGSSYSLAALDDEELDRLFTHLEMEEWEKREVKKKAVRAREEYVTRYASRRRLARIEKKWRDFRSHLDTNSIFFQKGLTERLRVLDEMIVDSNIEYQVEINEIGFNEEFRTKNRFEKRMKLRKEGEPLLRELEKLVRQRIWSAAEPTQSALDLLAATPSETETTAT